MASWADARPLGNQPGRQVDNTVQENNKALRAGLGKEHQFPEGEVGAVDEVLRHTFPVVTESARDNNQYANPLSGNVCIVTDDVPNRWSWMGYADGAWVRLWEAILDIACIWQGNHRQRWLQIGLAVGNLVLDAADSNGVYVETAGNVVIQKPINWPLPASTEWLSLRVDFAVGAGDTVSFDAGGEFRFPYGAPAPVLEEGYHKLILSNHYDGSVLVDYGEAYS